MNELSNFNVMLVGHQFVYGPLDDLEWYLKPQVKLLTVVRMPLYPSRYDDKIHIMQYEKGKILFKKIIKLPFLTIRKTLIPIQEILPRLAMYLLTQLEVMGSETYDIAIAQDPVTSFIAIIMRKVRKVQNVIFQSHSYTAPSRSPIYKLADLYATQFSDAVWALSKRLMRVRENLGARAVIHVPICIRDDAVDYINNIDVEKENSAIYIGRLSEDKGSHILLRIMPFLIKVFKKVHIVGKGPYAKLFKQLSYLNSSIKFHGPLPLKESMLLAKKAMLGIMLTRPSLELLTTDPMKPKVYLATHTPVILPKYIELADEVRKFNAGIVLEKLDPTYIRRQLRKHATRLGEYSEGAKKLAAEKSYWKCSIILSRALRETLKIIEKNG